MGISREKSSLNYNMNNICSAKGGKTLTHVHREKKNNISGRAGIVGKTEDFI